MNRATRLRFGPMLLGLVVIGVAIRLVYVFTVGQQVKPGLDAIFYMLTGGLLASGHGYADPKLFLHGTYRPTANFPPLFPLFIAGLIKLGVKTTTGYQAAGALLGGATVALTGVLGRRVSGKAAVGLLAAALVAISPALVAGDASIMSEPLAVPIETAVLLAATWAAETGSWRRWGVVGALAGLAALVRTEALVIVVLVVPALAVASPRTRRRGTSVAVALVAAGCVVSPWVIRNVTQFDPPVLLSTNGAKTFAGANCHSVYYGADIGLWDANCLGGERQFAQGEGQYSKALLDEGAHYAVAHAPRVPLVVGARVLRGWGLYNPRQQVRWEAVETRSVGWGQLAWPVSLVVLALAVYGLAVVRPPRFELTLLAAPPLAATVVLAVSNGNQRLVVGAVPVLCISAAMALVHLAARAKEPIAEDPGRATPRTS
jgi:4-amino-4-deoxy-L-arabinose transferase-like glycosyltransferase